MIITARQASASHDTPNCRCSISGQLDGDVRGDPATVDADRTARLAAMRRVQTEETVAAVARDLQIGWHTVMRAVVAYDTLLIDDPNRLAGVDTLGIDEHV